MGQGIISTEACNREYIRYIEISESEAERLCIQLQRLEGGSASGVEVALWLLS
jgi:hypothetical protein